MIKIGIDARSLSRPVTGIGRYTFDMCKALSQCPEVSLTLYSPAEILTQYREQLDKCVIRDFKSQKSGIFRQVWGETFLPLWAYQDRVDILWGPSHRIPRISPPNCVKLVTIHDLVWKFAGETMRPISKILERIQMPHAVKAADHVIVSSSATLRDLERILHVPPAKMSLIYPTVDIDSPRDLPSSFSIVDEKLEGRSFGLFVGTLEPRKNLLRLLEAYSQLPAPSQEKCHIVIAGGKGWGKFEFQKKMENWRINDKIHFTGYVDELSLQYLYSKARFSVMPSIYEGFGLPISEAMKYGTPAIVGNNSSMPEVVGPAGLLVDAKDIDSISGALEILINDDVLRNDLSEKAINHVKTFATRKSIDALLNVFKNSLKN